MPEPQRHEPDDPREWLNRARSDLALAQNRIEGVYLEDLCFHAQQAAEKAIKAMLIYRDVEFPYVHDLSRLLELVSEAGVIVPQGIRSTGILTRFAVVNRYPGLGAPVTEEDYTEAVKLGTAVVAWAEQVIGKRAQTNSS